MALKSTLESAKARLNALLTYANEPTEQNEQFGLWLSLD